MSWSAEQAEVLRAMGLTPYVRVAVNAATATIADASDRLALALQRAARGRDVRALIADFDALRSDPQRKRQLWPQLRALRRVR